MNTNKIQKIKNWISKEQDGLMDAQGNFEYPEHEGAYHILCNLDAYIDSLQEEPVREELEEAANEIVNNAVPPLAAKYKDGTYVGGIRDYFDRKEFIDLVKAGSEWKEEQMIANAVETTFNVSLPSGLYDKLWIKGCKEGDKLLVIKKDEL